MPGRAVPPVLAFTGRHEKTEKREIELIAQSLGLSQRDSVQLSDRMSALRYRWGAEVFALGLQLGVRLTAPSLSVEDHP